jgi:hypothetical protein
MYRLPEWFSWQLRLSNHALKRRCAPLDSPNNSTAGGNQFVPTIDGSDFRHD